MIGYAFGPFLAFFILWLFRPLVMLLWRELPEGRAKRILFYSWRA